MWTESQELRRFIAGYLTLLPLKKAAVEIDKRFVEYLLELSDGVTGRITKSFGAPPFRDSPTNPRKWGSSNSNTWVPACQPSSVDGRDFSFRTSLRQKRTSSRKTHIGDENMLNVNGRPIPFDTAIARNIDPDSTAGLPGLVLPAGLTPGDLPVALEFDGPAGSDRALLSVGMSLERALGALPAPRI